MAKAILEFDLNDPDDVISFKRAARADDMTYCLWQIVSNTWRQFKHVDGLIDYEDYKQAVYEEVENHGLDMDSLLGGG